MPPSCENALAWFDELTMGVERVASNHQGVDFAGPAEDLEGLAVPEESLYAAAVVDTEGTEDLDRFDGVRMAASVLNSFALDSRIGSPPRPRAKLSLAAKVAGTLTSLKVSSPRGMPRKLMKSRGPLRVMPSDSRSMTRATVSASRPS
jgi:hypothetical protein